MALYELQQGSFFSLTSLRALGGFMGPLHPCQPGRRVLPHFCGFIHSVCAHLLTWKALPQLPNLTEMYGAMGECRNTEEHDELILDILESWYFSA
jgi:hypothetical protein